MPSQKNIDQLAGLKNKLAKAKSVVFADYHGLSVSQQQELRSKIIEAAGEFTVAKNTLLKLALKDTSMGLPSDLEEILSGATALLISTEDEISPLKALVEFAQDHDLPKVKAGILNDRLLSPEEINDLAKLPGRNDLYAKLVGTLNAPRVGLVNVLQGSLRKLVYVLKAIEESKSEAPNPKS